MYTKHDDKIKLIREKILKSHTLEGVLSMPDELFYNSNAGVVVGAVTCQGC